MSAYRLCIDEERISFLRTLTRFFARSRCFAAFLLDRPNMPSCIESGMP